MENRKTVSCFLLYEKEYKSASFITLYQWKTNQQPLMVNSHLIANNQPDNKLANTISLWFTPFLLSFNVNCELWKLRRMWTLHNNNNSMIIEWLVLSHLGLKSPCFPMDCAWGQINLACQPYWLTRAAYHGIRLGSWPGTGTYWGNMLEFQTAGAVLRQWVLWPWTKVDLVQWNRSSSENCYS